jgi:hypothetical protein
VSGKEKQSPNAPCVPGSRGERRISLARPRVAEQLREKLFSEFKKPNTKIKNSFMGGGKVEIQTQDSHFPTLCLSLSKSK